MENPTGYSRLQIGLHWAIALLIGFQVLFHEGMETAYKAFQRGQEVTGNAAQLHVLAGIAVLVLVVIRLIVRLKRGAPGAPVGGNQMQELAAKVVHKLLYFLMLAVPASGMAAWFGGIKQAADGHEVLFKVLLITVLLHTLAALYHHYFLKNGLLKRMMKSG